METKGLSKKEAQTKLKTHGLNILKMKRKKSVIVSFLEEFKDLMVIILIIAAGFSLIAGETQDGSVILFIVFLNATIGFIQKYKAGKAVEALQKLVSPRAKVIRDGETQDIEAKFLVPGDLIVLAEGDFVPADAKLIEENEIKIDESTLTGESIPVPKDIKGEIFMGTNVTHGSGKAIITCTGMDTQFGKIAHLTTTTEKDKSPLQKELFRIGVFVGKITLTISAILLATGVFVQGKPFVYALLFATAVAVAAVPEGLPATITIALAMGVQRLAKKNAIVKQLSSIETLGSTTVICSDKTGTLTRNEMTVTEIKTLNGEILLTDKIKNAETRLIAKIGTLCNNAKLSKIGRTLKIIGDPTEGALLYAAQKLGFKDFKNKKIYEIPFDSIRRTMSVIIKEKTGLQALTKGAPDSIIEKCTHVLLNGKKIKLTPKMKKELLEQNEEMAKRALRVLAFAYKENIEKKKKYTNSEIEKDLIFVCLTGMIDPPRPDVKEAIKASINAGIKTYIVTGDHGLTAHAIAKQIGLANENTQIITGDKFEKLNKNALKKIFKDKSKSIIFARSKPEHKLKIVEILKELGEIVAVTGDGVNDAPALKRADIGVAMGKTGTDVSREAANMVLADDSYSTIICAIEEGRTIYENLRKFVFYIFSCNVGELLTIFAGIIIGLPAPLTAILILAIDLGTDVLPAIALGIDSEEKGIMNKKPRDPSEKIMNKKFISRFVFLGTVIGTTVVLTFIWSLTSNGWQFGEEVASNTYMKASTMAFVILVMIQMINTFNARSETKSVFRSGMKTNFWLIGAITISVIFAISFVEIAPLQNFLGTTALTIKEWGIVIVAGFSVLIAEEIRKLFTRKYV